MLSLGCKWVISRINCLFFGHFDAEVLHLRQRYSVYPPDLLQTYCWSLYMLHQWKRNRLTWCEELLMNQCWRLRQRALSEPAGCYLLCCVCLRLATHETIPSPDTEHDTSWTIYPNTPLVCGVGKIILLLLMESEPPQSPAVKCQTCLIWFQFQWKCCNSQWERAASVTGCCILL